MIRHVSGDRVVSVIEIVSHGNKSSRAEFQEFLDKLAAVLAQGIQALVIDLHPRTLRDPEGIHAAIWNNLTGHHPEQFPDQPLTLAAYTSGPVYEAYYEPVAVSMTLPEMPVFLDARHYVDLPLEAPYMDAFSFVPAKYRAILQAP